MTTTALVQRVSPDTWAMIQAIAPTIHQAHLYTGVNSAEQAAIIMMTGYELGFGFTASFEFLSLIQGKPTLSPRGALALIYQSGDLEALKIEDGEHKCAVTMRRRNGIEYTATFSTEDAKRAGLIKPDGAWAKYEANMLRARAIGFAADVVFPDIIGGLRRADELGAAVDDGGNVIDGTAVAP